MKKSGRRMDRLTDIEINRQIQPNNIIMVKLLEDGPGVESYDLSALND